MKYRIIGLFLLGLSSIVSCEKTKPTIGKLPPDPGIEGVRALLDIDATGSKTTVPAGVTLTGIVVSNVLQEDSNAIYLQEQQTGFGIKLKFAGSHTYKAGDMVQVYVAGQALTIDQGDYLLDGIPLINANKKGSGMIDARRTTVDSAVANFRNWSESLIGLNSMRKAGSLDDSTFILEDSATGHTIQLFISRRLDYTPPDSMQAITGYLCKSGGNIQLRIRTPNDIVGYAPPVYLPDTVREGFESGGVASYAGGDQVYTGFPSGDWMFNDAAVYDATQVNDLRVGNGSVRLRGKPAGGGYIYTLFDVKGLNKVRFLFGGTTLGEGGDEGKQYAVETFISKDGGAAWTSLGVKNGVRGSLTLMEYPVTSLPTDNVRVKIANASYLRSSGTRLRANIDEVELIH